MTKSGNQEITLPPKTHLQLFQESIRWEYDNAARERREDWVNQIADKFWIDSQPQNSSADPSTLIKLYRKNMQINQLIQQHTQTRKSILDHFDFDEGPHTPPVKDGITLQWELTDLDEFLWIVNDNDTSESPAQTRTKIWVSRRFKKSVCRARTHTLVALDMGECRQDYIIILSNNKMVESVKS